MIDPQTRRTSNDPLPPFAATSGCGRGLKLLLVGEAWGESEAMARRPFVGSSGKELFLMLGEAMPGVETELWNSAREAFWLDAGWLKQREAWLEAVGIGMTNVLALRPPENKLDTLCVSKKELPDNGKGYPFPAITNGRYLRPEYLPEVERLRIEIDSSRPNLTICLGNTACWAVLGNIGIGGIRGTVGRSIQAMGGGKSLATYHPAGVMRNWAWRPIVVADLMKGWREAQFPNIIRPSRRVVINPTIEEVEQWVSQTLSAPPPLLSVDIETAKGMITCIGFGRSRREALVVPFGTGGNYWPTASLEARAWENIWKLLASPVPKLFQNGMYDLQYIAKLGLHVANPLHDSMLLHHSILPEMQKGLGFLGSVYTSEPAWKLMRKHRADEVGVKADE